MHIKNLFVGVICTVSLFLNGCFDRKEKIAIDHNGNTTINTSITGTTEKYPPLFKLPIDDPWKIIKQEIKKNKEGETEIEIISEMDIPYGEILPDRYDFKDEADQGLRFPSTLKIYKKGNRTFYEFTRRYKSRKHNPYEIYYESIDKELEEKILDAGIFSVPENDRIKYLDQFTKAFYASESRFFYDVLGLMVLDNDIGQGARKKMLKTAMNKLQEQFTADRFIQILALIDENKIDAEFSLAKEEVDPLFTSVFKNHVQPDNNSLLKKFTKLLKNERLANDITWVIGPHGFHITLEMPGQIVETNGLPEEDSMGTVAWHFKGSELRDCEYILHAVSVVDN